MASTSIHDIVRIPNHLLLGIFASDVGTDDRTRLCFAVDVLDHAKKNSVRLSTTLVRSLGHGWDARFGRLVDGGRLTVDLDDTVADKTEVVLDIQPTPKKEGKSKPEEATAG